MHGTPLPAWVKVLDAPGNLADRVSDRMEEGVAGVFAGKAGLASAPACVCAGGADCVVDEAIRTRLPACVKYESMGGWGVCGGGEGD